MRPDSQSDFGSYNCTATNEMGSESKEFLLIQAGLLALQRGGGGGGAPPAGPGLRLVLALGHAPTESLSSTEVPSAPDIQRVEPFSSTAVLHFEEPASSGGVPILRYRLQWRRPGRDWQSKELRAEEGEATSRPTPPLVGVGVGVRLDPEPDSTRPLHPPRSVFSACLSPLTDSSTFTIVGLWPESNYEVKMSAVNGKGEGESSSTTYFKTEQLSK